MTVMVAAAGTAQTATSAPDIRIAVVGLIGALIGGLSTFLGVWWRGSFDARQARRERLAALCDDVVQGRWQLLTISEHLDRIEQQTNLDAAQLAALREKVDIARTTEMAALARLSLHASDRVGKACGLLMEAEGMRDISTAMLTFIKVVRAEISPSLRERLRLRLTPMDKIHAKHRETWWQPETGETQSVGDDA